MKLCLLGQDYKRDMGVLQRPLSSQPLLEPEQHYPIVSLDVESVDVMPERRGTHIFVSVLF